MDNKKYLLMPMARSILDKEARKRGIHFEELIRRMILGEFQELRVGLEERIERRLHEEDRVLRELQTERKD